MEPTKKDQTEKDNPLLSAFKLLTEMNNQVDALTSHHADVSLTTRNGYVLIFMFRWIIRGRAYQWMYQMSVSDLEQLTYVSGLPQYVAYQAVVEFKRELGRG